MRASRLLTTIIVTLLPRLLCAQTPQPACVVEINAPAMNARLGETANVAGAASIPPGTRLWVFAHRKGLALWWPQGSGPAKLDGDKWQVVAYLGVPRDIGSEFEIAERVIDAKGNSNLEKWVKDTEDTGPQCLNGFQVAPRRR
jgi:hypothetical protein